MHVYINFDIPPTSMHQLKNRTNLTSGSTTFLGELLLFGAFEPVAVIVNDPAFNKLLSQGRTPVKTEAIKSEGPDSSVLQNGSLP
jgi:hypothetical protein